jgi:hypothetical protein
MNLFTALGFICLLGSEFYRPWRAYWREMKSTPGDIYRAYRQGTAPRRPMWSHALQVIGLALMVLGFWRLFLLAEVDGTILHGWSPLCALSASSQCGAEATTSQRGPAASSYLRAFEAGIQSSRRITSSRNRRCRPRTTHSHNRLQRSPVDTCRLLLSSIRDQECHI